MATRIRHEAEPVEVVEECPLVFRPAADPIVILDPQPDAAAERPCHAPDVDGVHDVAEVQVPCR